MVHTKFTQKSVFDFSRTVVLEINLKNPELLLTHDTIFKNLVSKNNSLELFSP